jgi:hypothetical protein
LALCRDDLSDIRYDLMKRSSLLQRRVQSQPAGGNIDDERKLLLSLLRDLSSARDFKSAVLESKDDISV